jgi:hypothetical protein
MGAPVGLPDSEHPSVVPKIDAPNERDAMVEMGRHAFILPGSAGERRPLTLPLPAHFPAL